MTIKTKKCSKCHEAKPLDEFYDRKSSKDGKRSNCKQCESEQTKLYRKEHGKKHRESKRISNEKYRQGHKKERREYDKNRYQNHKEEMDKKSKVYYQGHKDEIRKQHGSISMYENKNCSNYLGIVIGERLIRHLFDDVEVMPFGNPNFDIICNKGKKIDIKIASMTFNNKGKYPRWLFHIDHNTIADFFILVAFDNIKNLNPFRLWMIPGNELNKKGNTSIALSRIHKWDKWKRNTDDARSCCAEIKNHDKNNLKIN